MTDETGQGESRDTRTKILAAASVLVAAGGVSALTTRAVAAASGVQAPTLYRLFGDKRGLLAAVAESELTAFVAGKAVDRSSADPVEELSAAWDDYLAFGLANPAVFAIIHEVGTPLANSPAALAGLAVLRARVERVAQAGRLAMSVDRAAALIHAIGVGTISTLLAKPVGERDAGLADVAREAMLAAVARGADDEPPADAVLASAAVTVVSRLDEVRDLSPGERLLLTELLSRVA